MSIINRCFKCKTKDANSSNRWLCKECKKIYDREYYQRIKDKRIKKYYKETEGKVKRRINWPEPPKDKEFYLEQYIKLNKTPKQIAKEFGLSHRMIFSAIKKHNIKKPLNKLNLTINNGVWKGNKVKYHALHAWIKRHKPTVKFCEECYESKPYDLANISGKYKRDITDFKWLCRKCHMNCDGRMNNLKQFQGGKDELICIYN